MTTVTPRHAQARVEGGESIVHDFAISLNTVIASASEAIHGAANAASEEWIASSQGLLGRKWKPRRVSIALIHNNFRPSGSAKGRYGTRNDGKTWLRDLAECFFREVFIYFPPSPN
jgi:hypothetical protein